MIPGAPNRVQYLASKVSNGVATQQERQELARLVGHNPNEFEGPNGDAALIAIALAALAAGIIIGLLLARR